MLRTRQKSSRTASAAASALQCILLLIVTAASQAQPSGYERGSFHSADEPGPGALMAGIGAAFSLSGLKDYSRQIHLVPHISLTPAETWTLKAYVPLHVAWPAASGTEAPQTAWPEISGRLGLTAQWHTRSMPWLYAAEARLALPFAGAQRPFPQEQRANEVAYERIDAFGRESLGFGVSLMRIVDPLILGASIDLGLIVPPHEEPDATGGGASFILRLGLSLTEAFNRTITAGIALYPGFDLNPSAAAGKRFHAFLSLQLWVALLGENTWVRVGSEEHAEEGTKQTAVIADCMYRLGSAPGASARSGSKD